MNRPTFLRRSTALLLTLVLMVCAALPGFAAYQMPIQTASDTESVYLFNLDTGKPILRQNSDQQRYIASLTKMMTALLFLESGKDMNAEITISTRDKADMLDNHRELNDLCHKMDSTRLTTLACYAMCGPFNPVAHITDLVSWNLYLGWYVPGLFLNDLWMGFFHLVYPNRPLGFSEYGAEGMPNLHSAKPRRGDHTEEYQAVYHEYMLRCFDRHKWMWATHVWNMFDFAADARDQGGEPGMNHKGLVTFDRKTKKDSFYLYKAWWSEENFVHICSKRFTDRTESEIEVKVYSNQKSVALYCNGKKLSEQTGEHVFRFRVPLTGSIEVKAVAGDSIDTASFRHVDTPNPSYKLVKTKSKSANWV